MRIVVEKFMCDVCGAEITDKKHYVITVGAMDSWTEDAKIEQLIKKDLCHECYETISQLISGEPVHQKIEEPVKPVVEPAPDGRRVKVDKDRIKELWGRGLSYKEITAVTGYNNNQISFVINRTSKEERMKLRSKYSNHANIQEEEKPGIRVTTDEYGFVISTK